MSRFEEIFMGAFYDTFSAEKTAQEVEMPVLDQALANLGLLDEGEEEEVEMPVLKQAMENLGLLEEEGTEEAGEEATSMLEELAQRHGPAVVEEREKLAMEKDAAGMLRTKAKTILKSLGKSTGVSDIREGLSRRRFAQATKKGDPRGRQKTQVRAEMRSGKKLIGKGKKKALEMGKKTAKGAALVAGGGVLGALAARKKKDKKKKK